jgi:hypothetical protein
MTIWRTGRFDREELDVRYLEGCVRNIRDVRIARKPYRSDVLLEELGPHNGRLDIVLDVCFAGEAAQGRRQSSLHMSGIIGGKLNIQLSQFDVFQWAGILLAVIVERKLVLALAKAEMWHARLKGLSNLESERI